MFSGLKKNLSKRWMPETRSQVLPVKSIPALCFRHDMDDCGADELEKFAGLERSLGIPSTCFFLRGQLDSLTRQVEEVADAGDEVALHSEARPRLEHSVVWLLWLTERSYRSNLRAAVRRMRRRGFDTAGHAPHSKHNYLGFQNWINWNTIEQATIGTGMSYLSGWRLPARAPEGTADFGTPLPPFRRVMGERSILVIPTAWDDKFFFSSYEDRQILGAASNQLSGWSVEQALDRLTVLLETCAAAEIPLVINLHPIHALRGGIDLFGLKAELAAAAKARNIPVITLKHLAEHLA